MEICWLAIATIVLFNFLLLHMKNECLSPYSQMFKDKEAKGFPVFFFGIKTFSFDSLIGEKEL